jgi:hypothetical protein
VEEDFALIHRAAFNCLPPLRHCVLDALQRGVNPYSLGKPESSVERAIEDLEFAGLVKRESHKAAHLTAQAKELIRGAGLSSRNPPDTTKEEGYDAIRTGDWGKVKIAAAG